MLSKSEPGAVPQYMFDQYDAMPFSGLRLVPPSLDQPLLAHGDE